MPIIIFVEDKDYIPASRHPRPSAVEFFKKRGLSEQSSLEEIALKAELGLNSITEEGDEVKQTLEVSSFHCIERSGPFTAHIRQGNV